MSTITHTRLPLKVATLTGGAAGNHTVTGIKFSDQHYVSDQIVAVLHFTITTGNFTEVGDLTSEFSITADNTINNTGGTDTTGDRLVVFYVDMDA